MAVHAVVDPDGSAIWCSCDAASDHLAGDSPDEPGPLLPFGAASVETTVCRSCGQADEWRNGQTP